MHASLGFLAGNLAAGARLALLMRSTRASFHVGPGQWLLAVLVSAGVDIVLDGLRASPGSTFTIAGIDAELFSVGLLMVTSGFIARLCRDNDAFLTLPLVVLASFPVLQVVHALPAIAGIDLGADGEFAFELFIVAWMIFVCIRAMYVVSETPARRRLVRAVSGGLLLSLPLWFDALSGPDAGWWAQDDGVTVEGADPASEPVMAAQSMLLDQALDALDEPREGVPDLYFVGFAPDARKDGFRQEVDETQHVLEERFGTGGRSLALVNHAQTVAALPFATLTNLRRVLEVIGDAIEPVDDVVMLYLTAGSSPAGGLAAVHPPLDLVPVTPELLKQLLDNAGIRYRVIVVSTCAAGEWLETFRDPDTAVLVSNAGRDSAGDCAGGLAPGAFGRSLYERALRQADTIPNALRQVAREAGEGAEARLAIGPGLEAQMRRVTRAPPMRTAMLQGARVTP